MWDYVQNQHQCCGINIKMVVTNIELSSIRFDFNCCHKLKDCKQDEK